MMDTIIEKGTIIDGSGAPRFQADIGITGAVISAVGDLSYLSAKNRISASGKVVSPGFINVHGHSDGWLLKKRHFTAQTEQGYTTEFLMTDGFSYAPVNEHTIHEWIHYLRTINALEDSDYTGWKSISDYMNLLHNNTAQNVVAQIPYSNLRSMVAGFSSRQLTDNELLSVKKMVTEGMEQGAVGLSTGLDYAVQCYATTEELISAASAMAKYNGIYITHMRYAIGRLEALKEAVEIGKRAKVAVHISHFMGRTPEESEQLIQYVNSIAVNEVDFSFDSIPYTSSCTLLAAQLPGEAWIKGSTKALSMLGLSHIRQKLDQKLSLLPLDRFYIAWTPNEEHKLFFGKSLSEYIKQSKKNKTDAVIDLLEEANLSVLCVNRYTDETAVFPFLSHSKFMLGSDGIWHKDGFLHPRTLGSTGRLLGSCVKKYSLFSLEDGVRKMTSTPAQKFRLKKRGFIKKDHYADLVIFDPVTITENATFDNPMAKTTGIESVFVNGVQIIKQGLEVKLPVPSMPGTFLGKM